MFPPRAVAAARACRGHLFESYETKHTWENGTHAFGVARPETPFVLTQPNASWVWRGDNLLVEGECVSVMVFSI